MASSHFFCSHPNAVASYTGRPVTFFLDIDEFPLEFYEDPA
jgi:hypothetical protein